MLLTNQNTTATSFNFWDAIAPPEEFQARKRVSLIPSEPAFLSLAFSPPFFYFD